MMVTEGLYILGISIDMVWVGRLGPAVIVSALAFTLYFLLGRWKRKRI
jgi:hypothetical protein